MRLSIVNVALAVGGAAGCADDGNDAPAIAADTSDVGGSTSTASAPGLGLFSLSSPVLISSPDCTVATPESCPVFPAENTSYQGNANVSPALTWSGVPTGTASFAITFTDKSFGQMHWAIWNIPATLQGLPVGVPTNSPTPAMPAGASQTNATFAPGDGYLGPQAPCNVYEFVLYALSSEMFTPAAPDYVTLVGEELEALGGAILGKATLNGRNFVASECQ